MNGLERAIAPMIHRVRLAIGLGLLRLVNDAGGLQVLQASVVGGEPRDGINRYQNYGHTSVPLPGARVLLAAVGGNLNHLVALVVDDARYRKRDLQPGESCLYTDEGDYVLLKRGRIVQVVAGTKLDVTAPEAVFNCSSKVTLNTPLLEVTGHITAGGNVSDATGSMQAMRIIYNGHTHGGGPTPSPSMS